jgi:TusA-related sulfurtransferase/rhodanese-related sulfurtransferase
MSESEYVLTIFKRYWKILLKWIFRIHGLPEITPDELYERINSGAPPLLIDIRAAEDFNGTRASEYGHIPNAQSIDILELESNLKELEPYKDKEIVTMCAGGGLSLAAVEILSDAEFKDVKSLKGGTDLWHKKGYPTTRNHTNIVETTIQQPSPSTATKGNENELIESTMIHKTLDARGLTCPMPMLKSRIALKELQINQVLEILTTDPGSIHSIPKWAIALGQELLASEELGPDDYRFLVRRLK